MQTLFPLVLERIKEDDECHSHLTKNWVNHPQAIQSFAGESRVNKRCVDIFVFLNDKKKKLVILSYRLKERLEALSGSKVMTDTFTWPSRSVLGDFLYDITPLIVEVENYLGLKTRLERVYDMECSILKDDLHDVLCIDINPHPVLLLRGAKDVFWSHKKQRHINEGEELVSAYTVYLMFEPFRMAGNRPFEISYGSRRFSVNPLSNGVSEAGTEILFMFDLDGLLSAKWNAFDPILENRKTLHLTMC